MNSEYLVQLIVGFLGGGVAGSLVSVWSNLHTQKKTRRIEEIRLQISRIYMAPFHSFQIGTLNC